MNLHDLAALVEVRNHIPVLLNNKNLTTKGDFRMLVAAMNKLGQQFVEAIKSLDYDNLFPPEMKCITVSSGDVQLGLGKELPYTSGYIQVESTKDVMEGVQILSPSNPNTTVKSVYHITEDNTDLKSSPSGVWEEDDYKEEIKAEFKEASEDKDFKTFNAAINPQYDHSIYNDAAAKAIIDDEALISERLNAQKEQLKKQGRSNKRISKSKEDDSKK